MADVAGRLGALADQVSDLEVIAAVDQGAASGGESSSRKGSAVPSTVART